MASPVDLDDAFAAVLDAREVRQRRERASRDLWRTHHSPERYERCLVVRGRHVCRRCTWLYSVAFAVLVAGLFGLSPWPPSLDVWFVWGLALPATIEFVSGELLSLGYSQRRQVAATLLLAPAIGRGMTVELANAGSSLFWGPVLVLGPIWFLAALIGWFRRTGQYRHASDELL